MNFGKCAGCTTTYNTAGMVWISKQGAKHRKESSNSDSCPWYHTYCFPSNLTNIGYIRMQTACMNCAKWQQVLKKNLWHCVLVEWVSTKLHSYRIFFLLEQQIEAENVEFIGLHKLKAKLPPIAVHACRFEKVMHQLELVKRLHW